MFDDLLDGLKKIVVSLYRNQKNKHIDHYTIFFKFYFALCAAVVSWSWFYFEQQLYAIKNGMATQRFVIKLHLVYCCTRSVWLVFRRFLLCWDSRPCPTIPLLEALFARLLLPRFTFWGPLWWTILWDLYKP